MTRGPRIGLFTPGWPGQNTPNGIATSVHYLAQGLHAAGAPPVIIADRLDAEAPAGIPVVHMPRLDWRWQDRLRARLGDPDAGHRYRARNIAAGVGQAIARHGMDLLIMEETNGWAGMVQQLVSCPVIATLHGPWTLLRPWVFPTKRRADTHRERRESQAFARVAGIIAPSQDVLNGIGRAGPMPEVPKAVLPNSLSAGPPPRPFAADRSGNILFVGRFDGLKGADVVLDAFARLRETHPEAALTFVGVDKGLRGPDGRMLYIEEALHRLPAPVRAGIRFAGPLDWAQIARLRASHPIALIASRYEVFGYTMLEAMAAGQAIVCTAVGGPAEVLEDQRTALLVPPGDAAATAAALGRLLDDAARARALGAAARAHLERHFSPEGVALQTLAFAETVMKTRPGL